MKHVEVYHVSWIGLLDKHYDEYLAGIDYDDCYQHMKNLNFRGERDFNFEYLGSANIIDVGFTGSEQIISSLNLPSNQTIEFTDTLRNLWRRNNRF